jgi:hypothetical protein
MSLPDVRLVTRPLLEGTEQVIAVMVGDQRLDVPLDSRVAVEYEAGAGPGIVHVEIISRTVRHVAEADL